jgi:hypothetical protein
MPQESPSTSELTSKILEEQLNKIKQRILKEAEASAMAEDRVEPELEDLSSAYLKYVPGTKAYRERYPSVLSIFGAFTERVFSSVTGLTLVTAILAVVFGWLGFRSQDTATRTGFLDICKILAGAVVGSTGTAAVGLKRKTE